ncbi:MAG TPA: Clp protease N-terminal domain-containing protein [Trebonia sp.]
MTRHLSWPTRFGRPSRWSSAAGPGVNRRLHRMTPAVAAIFRGGFAHAVRLGHRHLGCEHLLLALVESDHEVAAALRVHGLPPERVLEQVLRLAGDAIFGGLDEDSLTAIGIDLGTVRERALASFGPDALSRASVPVGADRARRPAPGSARWVPGGPGRTLPGVWHGGVFLPHSPDVGELLRVPRSDGLLEPGAPYDVPHLAVGLVSVAGGAVPPLLAALDVRPAVLRAAVERTGEPGGA